ncbi:MAG: hypothetical protein WB439_13755 [Acidobacteriaceae bacterium]
MAVYAGVLTVESLPETVSKRRRRLHLVFFVIGGLVLFVFTAMIGILNDQSQQAADARSQRDEVVFRKIYNLQQEGNQKLDPAVASLNPASLSKAQKDGFEEARRFFTQVAVTADAASQHPSSAPSRPATPIATSFTGSSAPPHTTTEQPAFDDAQRAQFRTAAVDANTVIADLAKQNKAAQNRLTGRDGVITKWRAEHPEAKDSDPLPQDLKDKVHALLIQRPDYSRWDSSLSNIRSELQICCSTDFSAMHAEERFGAARNGEGSGFANNQKQLSTVGDLKDLNAISTQDAQGLLRGMAQDLTDAANKK